MSDQDDNRPEGDPRGGDSFARRPSAWSPLTMVLGIVLVVAAGHLAIGWHQARVVTAEWVRTMDEVRTTVARHRVDTLTNHLAILRAIGADPAAIHQAEASLAAAVAAAGGAGTQQKGRR